MLNLAFAAVSVSETQLSLNPSLPKDLVKIWYAMIWYNERVDILMFTYIGQFLYIVQTTCISTTSLVLLSFYNGICTIITCEHLNKRKTLSIYVIYYCYFVFVYMLARASFNKTSHLINHLMRSKHALYTRFESQKSPIFLFHEFKF